MLGRPGLWRDAEGGGYGLGEGLSFQADGARRRRRGETEPPEVMLAAGELLIQRDAQDCATGIAYRSCRLEHRNVVLARLRDNGPARAGVAVDRVGHWKLL